MISGRLRRRQAISSNRRVPAPCAARSVLQIEERVKPRLVLPVLRPRKSVNVELEQTGVKARHLLDVVRAPSYCSTGGRVGSPDHLF